LPRVIRWLIAATACSACRSYCALGINADKIAEVDVTDREDLRVIQPYEGRMVTLLLGDQNFAVRYQNFLNHYAEIHEKMPEASSLDLRMEDRITVVQQKDGA
jgi:cell division protein FtsQ